jgi:hypothetical protein
MRIIVSALLALSVLAVAAPAGALDAKSLFGQQERESGGSSGSYPGSPVHKSGLVPMAPE